jgi:uridylate kinase
MPKKPAYKRVMLKISGEALGKNKEVFDSKEVSRIAHEVAGLVKLGVQVGVVVGGGNIFRGREAEANGITEVVGHQMGMLATIINGLALQNVLENMKVQTRLMSAIEVNEFCEPYRLRRAIRHLEKGRVVIFVAGTGNTFFTTDSAAALRGIECGAEVLLKATNVDGAYDSDPHVKKSAKKYAVLNYQDALEKNVRVMDKTAFALASEELLPIIIFNLEKPGNLQRVVLGENVGTRVNNSKTKLA